MNSLRRPYLESFGVFLLALLIIFLKMPTRITEGFLWAEDTSIFMKGAYEQGLLSLSTPYAGYLHLFSRLLAYLGSLFVTPLGAPYFYVLATTLITAFCSAYIFGVLRRYFQLFKDPGTTTYSFWNDSLALLAALSFFLIPHQGEVLLNITNLQWVLAPTMLVLLLDLFVLKEKRLFFLEIKTGFLFLLALTGPFSLLFIPFVALLIMRELQKSKNITTLLPLVTFFIATLIQARILWSQQAPMNPIAAINWWDKIDNDLLAQLFFVTPPFDFFLGRVCIALLPFLILLSIVKTSKRSFVPLLLLATALELWCLSLWFRPLPPNTTFPIGPCAGNARYYFVPAILLSWALIMSIKLLSFRSKIIPSLLLTMMFLTGVIRFQGQKHPKWAVTQEGPTYEVAAPFGWKATITPK